MSDDLPAPAGNLSVSTNKEIENVPAAATEGPTAKEAGQETDRLPKEVTSAGVSIHPTTISVPAPVQQMGVKPAGANIPMPVAAVTLPISDDQIARGLRQSVTSSLRWLAEWCLRRLKQVHMGLKNIHGKLTRVRT